MKKLIVAFLSLFLLSGCELNSDIFKAETIRTSVYPIEFITDYLYGFDAKVTSIYPDGADYKTYNLTDKLIENYSDADLFIYNGSSKENKIAIKLFNNNEDIQIINAMRINSMQEMTYKYGIEELWLDPSNFLMVASNIKNGLLKLSPNKQTSEKIIENYENLKVEVSKLDVELSKLQETATYKTIVTTNYLFKYLNKYDIEVIVLNEDNPYINRTYEEVKALAKKGTIKYLYALKGETIPTKLANFIKDNNITKIEIDPLDLISESSRSNKENYITIMTDNINNYKKELEK